MDGYAVELASLASVRQWAEDYRSFPGFAPSWAWTQERPSRAGSWTCS